MGELGWLPTEGAIKQNLLRRVADVVATARHESDAHLVIVYGRRQVVERVAVRTHQHEILLCRVRRADRAKYAIDEYRRALARRFETHDVRQIRAITTLAASAGI